MVWCRSLIWKIFLRLFIFVYGFSGQEGERRPYGEMPWRGPRCPARRTGPQTRMRPVPRPGRRDLQARRPRTLWVPWDSVPGPNPPRVVTSCEPARPHGLATRWRGCTGTRGGARGAAMGAGVVPAASCVPGGSVAPTPAPRPGPEMRKSLHPRPPPAALGLRPPRWVFTGSARLAFGGWVSAPNALPSPTAELLILKTTGFLSHWVEEFGKFGLTFFFYVLFILRARETT